MPAAASRLTRLPAINGLRGIAILAVVYCHLVAGLWAEDGVPRWLSPLLTNGWTGVNLFFILSGFVLYLPYAAGERRMDSVPDRVDFYRRRVWRLMPLFYVAVAAQWAVAAVRGEGTGIGELAAVLSVGFVFDPRTFGPSFNVTLWSIGVEIAFSALFPLLILGLRRWGIARFVAAILVLALAARVVGIWRFPEVQSIAFNTDGVICRIDEFVLGLLLAHCHAAGRLPRRPAVWAGAGIALVGLAWVGFDLTLHHALPALSRAVLNNVLDAGLCAVALAALCPGTRLARALAWPPLQLLGMMCYSLYIWHWPMLGWVMPGKAEMAPATFAAGLSLYLFLVVGVAALSYRFIEFGHARDWRKLFLPQPPPRAAVADSPRP